MVLGRNGGLMGLKLTTAQAAARLKISRCRLRVLITTGRLKAKRFGFAWLIDERDLGAVRNRKPGRPKKG